MKTIRLFLLGSLSIYLVHSCDDKSGVIIADHGINTYDTLNMGCLASYDLNLYGKPDTINKVFGEEKIKHGFWIKYGIISQKQTQSKNAENEEANKAIRVKVEEGYYKYNMREGFWKIYNNDGTLKDSVEFINDIPVENHS